MLYEIFALSLFLETFIYYFDFIFYMPSIKVIGGILVIVVAIFAIVGIKPIMDWEIWDRNESPNIELKMEPPSINGGQYEKIDIKITIPDLIKNNVTYLVLAENNI